MMSSLRWAFFAVSSMHRISYRGAQHTAPDILASSTSLVGPLEIIHSFKPRHGLVWVITRFCVTHEIEIGSVYVVYSDRHILPPAPPDAHTTGPTFMSCGVCAWWKLMAHGESADHFEVFLYPVHQSVFSKNVHAIL